MRSCHVFNPLSSLNKSAPLPKKSALAYCLGKVMHKPCPLLTLTSRFWPLNPIERDSIFCDYFSQAIFATEKINGVIIPRYVIDHPSSLSNNGFTVIVGRFPLWLFSRSSDLIALILFWGFIRWKQTAYLFPICIWALRNRSSPVAFLLF